MKKLLYPIILSLVLLANAAFALVAPIVPASACTVYASGGAISWGLGNFGYERTPQAPSGADTMLQNYDGFFYSRTDAENESKKFYLTFDLGYEAGYTGEVLDILKKYNANAIFFLCSHYLLQEGLTNRMINEGHQIGNHTHKHKDLPTLTDSAIIEDIDLFTQKFNNMYGETYKRPLKFFRPGKGRFDERTLKHAKDLNMNTIMWSLAVADWGSMPFNYQAASSKIESRIHPGAIILLHISNASAPRLLETFIPKLVAKGYSIGCVNSL